MVVEVVQDSFDLVLGEEGDFDHQKGGSRGVVVESVHYETLIRDCANWNGFLKALRSLSNECHPAASESRKSLYLLGRGSVAEKRLAAVGLFHNLYHTGQ